MAANGKTIAVLASALSALVGSVLTGAGILWAFSGSVSKMRTDIGTLNANYQNMQKTYDELRTDLKEHLNDHKAERIERLKRQAQDPARGYN